MEIFIMTFVGMLNSTILAMCLFEIGNIRKELQQVAARNLTQPQPKPLREV